MLRIQKPILCPNKIIENGKIFMAQIKKHTTETVQPFNFADYLKYPETTEYTHQ